MKHISVLFLICIIAATSYIVYAAEYTEVGYLHWTTRYNASNELVVSWSVGFRSMNVTDVVDGELVFLDETGNTLDRQPNVFAYRLMTDAEYNDDDTFWDVLMYLFSQKDTQAVLDNLSSGDLYSKRYILGISQYWGEWWETEDVLRVTENDDGTYDVHLKNGSIIFGFTEIYPANTLDEIYDIISNS